MRLCAYVDCRLLNGPRGHSGMYVLPRFSAVKMLLVHCTKEVVMEIRKFPECNGLFIV